MMGPSPVREESDDFREPPHDVATTSGATAAGVAIGGAVSSAKTFMSVSNEYWLIGIIIVLVTVILMLIVYIVKIRQTKQEAIGDAADSSKSEPRGADDRAGEASRDEHMQRLSHRAFVPRSNVPRGEEPHRGPHIEPVDDEPAREETSEEGAAGSQGAPGTVEAASMPFSMCRDAGVVMPASRADASANDKEGGEARAAPQSQFSPMPDAAGTAPPAAGEAPATPARRGRRRAG
jgi:hypothetical protein